MPNHALLIFVKNPALGKVKTRLARTFGDVKALEIYRLLLRHTAHITAPLPDTDKIVFYSDNIETNDCFDDEVFLKQVQIPNPDLGARMLAAFEWAQMQGYQHSVIIGSDCYELTTGILIESFFLLRQNNFVIGAAHDGGYYLLGMNEIHPSLFFNKQWSTDTVFTDTLADINKTGSQVALLPVLSDVDEAEDWERYAAQNNPF